MEIFVRICGIIACFLFATAFASGAGKAFDEKKWDEFGVNCTLTVCFWFGICYIIQTWAGIV